MKGLFILLLGKKMRNPNEFAYSIRLFKATAYDETVGFNEGETVRTVFARAWVDYEEWTNNSCGLAYTADSELDASDNNATLEITTKQIKQG